MRLNWLAYNYRFWDGYGGYSGYMVRALRRAGVQVTPHFAGAAKAPQWLLDEWGIDLDMPTISCLPPFYLQSPPKGSAPHWLLTMTEGSACPEGWAQMINESGVARVLTPCQHNADAFAVGGVACPITVIPGGTDPDEFPLLPAQRPASRPYTFLALADRGGRKGYDEVYRAFFLAFGGKTTGDKDVRLVVKARPDGNPLINFFLPRLVDPDKRIVWDTSDVKNMRDLYAQVDCFAIPSRSEGWGMPHREAAMMGLPVITQRYSGMDDGYTDRWALVVEGGQMQQVEATKDNHLAGQYRVCDVEELAAHMRWCYEHRDEAAAFGQRAATWLRANQTWDHTAARLLQVLHNEGVLQGASMPEMEYA